MIFYQKVTKYRKINVNQNFILQNNKCIIADKKKVEFIEFWAKLTLWTEMQTDC